MDRFLKIIKGFLVGFIILIPGVSAGMIAAALGIYEILVTALGKITKNPIKTALSVWEYAFGMVLGVVASIIFIATIYTKFPIQVTFLFLGLIIGGIPALYKENKHQFNKWYHYLTIAISIIAAGLLLLIPIQETNGATSAQLLLFALLGFLIAGPIILPGVSGAMILSMLGYYTLTVTTIKDFMKYFFTLQFDKAFIDIWPIFFMGIGGVIGLIVFAKLISYIIEKYNAIFNAVVLGVLLVAPMSVVISLNKEMGSSGSSLGELINTGNIIVGVIFLLFGFLLSFKTSSLKNKQINKVEVLNTFRTTHFMLIDTAIIVVSYALMVLTFNFIGFEFDLQEMIPAVATIVLAKITIFYLLGLYRVIIKFLDHKNLIKIMILVVGSNILIVGMLLIPNIPNFMYKASYIFITAFELAGFIGYRILLKAITNLKDESKNKENLVPTIIIGAGRLGEMALIEALTNKKLNNNIIGFLDDNTKKIGMSIMDKPILGTIDELEEIVKKYNVGEVIFAISNYSKTELNKIINTVSQMNKVKLRRLIMSDEYLDGNKIEIKNVKPEDLLDLKDIEINESEIKHFIKDKTVLITGAGSIGFELVNQLNKLKPNKVIVYDISEKNLKVLFNRFKNNDIDIIPVIGSVNNIERLDEIFNKYQPNIIYHTSLYQNIALIQDNQLEAIRTNIFGTLNIINFANKYNVENVLIISSDESIEPINIVGASQNYMNRLVKIFNNNQTKLSIVRFGDILRSSGGIVNDFQRKIEEGGPIEVTSKETTRYFMDAKSIVKLMLQASTFAQGGESFVLDMGDRVSIYELALKMIYLSDLTPFEDIDIKIIGLKPFEKLHSSLSINELTHIKTKHNRIYLEKETNVISNEFKEILKKEINYQTLKETYKLMVKEFNLIGDSNENS